jgi:hypothetical protein
MRVLIVGALFLLGLTVPTFGANPSSRMTFTVEPPTGLLYDGSGRWTIYADGPIDSEASERLRLIVKGRSVPPGTTFYLHSPGGNLRAAIEIGKILRTNSFQTYVGRSGVLADDPVMPGECYSACTIAYLGGFFRFMYDDRNSFGVHRISKSTKSSDDFDLGQIAAATVTEYLKEMDIDPAFLSHMTTTSSEEIHLLDRPTLEKLRVVNNGALPPSWTVRAGGGLIYLRGMQESTNGLNKLIFLCDAGRLHFTPIYDVGSPERAKNIISFTLNPSLILDGTMHSLTIIKEEAPSHNNIMGEYIITSELAYRMISAERIGFALRTHNPIFYHGFDIPVQDGRETLTSFLQNCFGR